MKPYLRLPSSEIAKFRANVHRVARETGTDCGVVMRSSMQQMVGMLSAYSYPRQKKQGEKAIETDLRRLVSTRKYDEVKKQYDKAEELNLLSMLSFKWEPGAIVWARQLTKQMGTAEGAYKYVLDQGAKALPAFHQRNRRKSDGRVVRNRGQFYAVAIGMQKYTDVLLMSNADFYGYARTVFQRVGRLKGGWNKAAEVWRAKVADWAWRHGTAEGAATDALKPDGSGFLRATNNVPYAYPKLKGLTTIAMRAAIRNVEKRLQRVAAKSKRV